MKLTKQEIMREWAAQSWPHPLDTRACDVIDFARAIEAAVLDAHPPAQDSQTFKCAMCAILAPAQDTQNCPHVPATASAAYGPLTCFNCRAAAQGTQDDDALTAAYMKGCADMNEHKQAIRRAALEEAAQRFEGVEVIPTIHAGHIYPADIAQAIRALKTK